jgi:hypothetical protein
MTFKEQIVIDAETVFFNTDECAEAITYTPVGSSTARSVHAVIDRDPRVPMKWDDGTGEKVEADIYVSSDANDGIPSPSPRDKFTFDGFNYYASEITPQEIDDTWKIRVVLTSIDQHGDVRTERL